MYPYAPILFDYIRRAMPMDRPQSLTADEVYAVSAYLLNLNGLMPANAVMDAKTAAGSPDAEPERVHRRRPAGRESGALHDELQVTTPRGKASGDRLRYLPGRRFCSVGPVSCGNSATGLAPVG